MKKVLAAVVVLVVVTVWVVACGGSAGGGGGNAGGGSSTAGSRTWGTHRQQPAIHHGQSEPNDRTLHDGWHLSSVLHRSSRNEPDGDGPVR